MGFPNTRIEVMGPASDDVGWLNAGAEIVVHGNAGNGIANAMAQGKVFVGGNIGARGMTMTKQNPRFAPPELWVLGSTGDYFGEFMAGGIAVVCGVEPPGSRQCAGLPALRGHGRRQGLLPRPPSGVQPGGRPDDADFRRGMGLAGREPGSFPGAHRAPELFERLWPTGASGSCWSPAPPRSAWASPAARWRLSTKRSGTANWATAGWWAT
ncbi:MAG: hypothetical protein U5J82_13385 [Desulfobacterales bacterium]|nr:hypothetical protein [Desulfobacterales bacterium]